MILPRDAGDWNGQTRVVTTSEELEWSETHDPTRRVNVAPSGNKARRLPGAIPLPGLARDVDDVGGFSGTRHSSSGGGHGWSSCLEAGPHVLSRGENFFDAPQLPETNARSSPMLRGPPSTRHIGGPLHASPSAASSDSSVGESVGVVRPDEEPSLPSPLSLPITATAPNKSSVVSPAVSAPLVTPRCVSQPSAGGGGSATGIEAGVASTSGLSLSIGGSSLQASPGGTIRLGDCVVPKGFSIKLVPIEDNNTKSMVRSENEQAGGSTSSSSAGAPGGSGKGKGKPPPPPVPGGKGGGGKAAPPPGGTTSKGKQSGRGKPAPPVPGGGKGGKSGKGAKQSGLCSGKKGAGIAKKPRFLPLGKQLFWAELSNPEKLRNTVWDRHIKKMICRTVVEQDVVSPSSSTANSPVIFDGDATGTSLASSTQQTRACIRISPTSCRGRAISVPDEDYDSLDDEIEQLYGSRTNTQSSRIIGRTSSSPSVTDHVAGDVFFQHDMLLNGGVDGVVAARSSSAAGGAPSSHAGTTIAHLPHNRRSGRASRRSARVSARTSSRRDTFASDFRENFGVRVKRKKRHPDNYSSEEDEEEKRRADQLKEGPLRKKPKTFLSRDRHLELSVMLSRLPPFERILTDLQLCRPLHRVSAKAEEELRRRSSSCGRSSSGRTCPPFPLGHLVVVVERCSSAG